jgi:quercetin dioxygenase-like cupin family protein
MLVPDLSGKLEAFYGRVAPGSGNVARRLREPTEEFIHVVSGVLKVGLLSGEYFLKPGDSIYFDGPSIVEISCASDEEAVWFSVITPPVF